MTTIEVSNISPLLGQNHLEELFGVCGKILTSHTRDLGNGNKICLIKFAEEAHAQAARMLNGTALGDREIQVVILHGTPPPPPPPPPPMFAPYPMVNDPLSLMPGAASVSPLANPMLGGLLNPAAAVAAQAAPQLLEASRRRADEVARTIYVGNLSPGVGEEEMKRFFSQVGEVLYTKIAGDNPSSMTKYGFVEFAELSQSAQAMTLSGSMLGDRAIKVGKANNPIVKANRAATADPDKLKSALDRVRAAQDKIDRKVGVDEVDSKRERGSRRRSRSRSRSRSGSRGRRRKSSSVRRPSRERERERGRRPERRRSRSRSRSPPPSRRERPKRKNEHEGEFWDGFQWNPLPNLDPAQAALLGMTGLSARR